MTPYETLSFIIIGFKPGLKMQIDEIKTGSWDYLSIIIELLCGIEVEGANNKGKQGDFV